MALPRTARRRWVEEGLLALAGGGPEAVRVETISQTLGVSKGGFYGYFKSRGALLDEVLDLWEREVTDTVIAQVELDGGDARAKLERLFAIVAASADPSARGIAAELTIRDWARRDHAVAARLRRVDSRRMAYLRSLFAEFCPDPDDVEVRCMLAYSLRLGVHLIVADHEGRSRAEVVSLTRRWLLR